MSDTLTIGDIALTLHQNQSQLLRFEFEPGTTIASDDDLLGYTVTNAVVRFETLADRNRHAAVAVLKQLRDVGVVDSDQLFERAYELWLHDGSQSDKVSGRLLVMATVGADLLRLASQRIRDGQRVFNVLYLVEAALPFMTDIDLGSLLDFCDAKHVPAQKVGAGSVIHGAIESWLISRPLKATELHGRVLNDLTEASAGLLGDAAVALSRSNFTAAIELAKDDAKSASILRAGGGIWTLGRLLMDDGAAAQHLREVAAAISTNIESTDDDRRARAIQVATRAMHRTSAFDSALLRLAIDESQDVLAGVATSFFLKTEEMTKRGYMPEWLDLMIGLKSGLNGSIAPLDQVLIKLMAQSANIPIVLEMLSKWAARHELKAESQRRFPEVFHGTIDKLTRMEPEWPVFLTTWMLSDEIAHPTCLGHVFANLINSTSPPPQFDVELLDGLDKEGLIFLARRMLGFVLDRKQATSLALSMLRSRDAKNRIFPILRDVLVVQIGYDYPESTIKACRLEADVVNSDEAKEFLSSAAEDVEKIGKPHSMLPRLKEFMPSMKLRRQFARARVDQMGAAFEEASKRSVLRHIATEIPIKAGRAMFSYRDTAYGPSLHLSKTSYSFEVPRRQVFDPIGDAIRIYHFRRATRTIE